MHAHLLRLRSRGAVDLWFSRVLHVTLAEDGGTTVQDAARFEARRIDPDQNLVVANK